MKTGLDDWYARRMGTRLDLEALVVESMPSAGNGWDRPVPLDDLAGPSFPLTALPDNLLAVVSGEATSKQVDPGLPAVMALGALSTAARGQYVVHVHGTDWHEPVVLQAVAVLPSGERKTAVVEEFRRTIEAKEQERRGEDMARLQTWESERRVLQKQLDQAESAAGKGSEPDAETIRTAALDELMRHDAERPVLTNYLVSDFTAEAAAAISCEQGGALATLDDEGQLFANLLNPYGKGRGPNFNFLLHGHNHGPIRVSRKGGPDLYVPRAAFTYAVACQPHVIESMGGIDGFRDRGGAARILPALLSSRIGTRTLEEPPVALEVRAAWARTISDMLDYSPPRQADAGGFPMPCALRLTRDAEQQFRHFWQEWEASYRDPTNPFAADRHLRAWGSKFPGAVLRIAGLLHLATHPHPEDTPITGDTMVRALAIGEYFAAHAVIFHRNMAGGAQSDARAVLDVLIASADEDDDPITRRDLHRRLKGRSVFRSPESLTKPLALLEDLGWIRCTRTSSSKGGRPSELINVNPWCRDAKTAKTQAADLDFSGIDPFGTLAPSFQADPDNLRTFPESLAPTGTDGDVREY